VESREVRVRLWAAARAAAGADELTVTVAPGASVADVRRAMVAALPDRPDLPRVLDVCSVLLGDRPMGSADAEHVPVPDGVDLEFLPPFAGG
jgi:sulfur-carrier protein